MGRHSYSDHYAVTGVLDGKRIKRTRFDTLEGGRLLLSALDSGTLWGVVEGMSYAYTTSASSTILEEVRPQPG